MLITEDKTSEHVNKRCGCQPKEDLLPSRSIPKGQPLTSPLKEPTVTQTSRILASLVLESEQLSRAPLYDDDEIDHDKTDTFKPWSTPDSDTDILSLIHLSGDEDLQSRLRTLCTEFADIFSNELPKEPADIPPFNLIVDDTKWKVGKNRAPPRSQSSVKQTALFNTIQTLISQGIVEKSQSLQCYAPFPYYKTEDPDSSNCSTERVRTLLRPLFFFFFTVFSLSRNDRNRGGGCRRKICTVPTPIFCLPDPLKKMMGSKSGPCVSECVHRYRWHYHATRQEKSGRSSVVLRTLSVLQLLESGSSVL